MKNYLLATCIALTSSLTFSAEAAPKVPVVKTKASPRSASFDNVVYLTKHQLFRLYPSLAQGNAGWPGDAKNPGIPVYPVAKNEAQLLWQVDEYNRMLRMAQEDIQMSEQVDGIDQKNNDIFNQAASNGDVQDMKASTAQSREIFKAMLKYGRDQEVHLFKALGLHKALLENAEFRTDYAEGDRAVDFSHTVTLVQKVNADELRFVSLRFGSTDNSAQSTSSSNSAAAVNDATSSLTISPLMRNTTAALAAKQVVFLADITDVFNTTAEINLSIENNSSHAIQFLTTPTMYYGAGYFSELKIRKVSLSPFPTPQEQMNNALATALAAGTGVSSGEILLQGDDPTADNTVIRPGTILYLRATCPLYGTDHTPTKFEFKGGGWDGTVVTISSE